MQSTACDIMSYLEVGQSVDTLIAAVKPMHFSQMSFAVHDTGRKKKIREESFS